MTSGVCKKLCENCERVESIEMCVTNKYNYYNMMCPSYRYMSISTQIVYVESGRKHQNNDQTTCFLCYRNHIIYTNSRDKKGGSMSYSSEELQY